MRITRFIASAVCFFFFIGTLKAQLSQVSLPTKSSPTANAPATQSPAYQLAVKVRRVVLDVVVTDAMGNPVEGLKQGDFKVTEDGAVQPVHFFDVHGGANANASQRALGLHLPANTYSNLALASPDKPVTILVYDLLNTPQSALILAHQAMVNFIKDQKGSTRVAIFVLSDRLHMVQGFTDDQTRLMEVVDSKKTKSGVSQLLVADTSAADSASLLASDPAEIASTHAAEGGGFDPSAREGSGERSGGKETPEGGAAIQQMLLNAEKEQAQYFLRERLAITVDAFTEIARFVSSLPGRKNLIWMSGSFPVELWPGRKQFTDDVKDWNIATFLEAKIRAAQEVLKESRVAIYPVDVRGLQVDPQWDWSKGGKAPQIHRFGGQVAMTFDVQQGAEHAVMDSIADTTGGRAFYNTNALRQAMDAAALNGSEYYTLTYAPTHSKDDGGERKIKVALTNAKYQLSYRRRYLALDATRPIPAQPLALNINMQHGTPNSTELFFEAKVNPVGTAMPASAAEVETIKTFLQTNAKDMRTKLASGAEKVQHYDIDFAIIGRQLEMPPAANGKYATAIRFGLGAFTDESELLNGMEVSIKNSIPAAQYQKIQSDGYHGSMIFVVPVEAVSLRLAVQDEIGNRIGTMEIPLPLPVSKNPTAAATP